MKKYIQYLIIFILSSFVLKYIFVYENNYLILESVKSFFLPLIDMYLLIFRNPNTSLILFLIIVSACVSSLLWIYFRKYIPLRKKLDFSIDKAEKIQTSIETKKISPLKGLSDFKDDDIVKSPILKILNSFLNNKKDFSLSYLESINLNILETKGFPLKIISALPGYFVGVGLVFTFLGLVAALYFSAQGMRSGNYEDARAAMMHLLYASSFKFVTSIAGISSSLLLSIFYKSLIHKLDLRIAKLRELMENMVYSLYEDKEQG